MLIMSFTASISVIKRLRCPGLDPVDRHRIKKKEITTCAKRIGKNEDLHSSLRLCASFMQMPFNQYILTCNRSQKARELLFAQVAVWKLLRFSYIRPIKRSRTSRKKHKTQGYKFQ